MTDDARNDARIDAWMKEFAAIDERDHVLPDPAVIWLKARVLQSAKAVERASRPITAMQIGAYIAVAACWAALLTLKSSAIGAWLDTMRPTHFLLSAAGPAASLSMSVLLAFLTLASVTAALAMHAILTEE